MDIVRCVGRPRLESRGFWEKRSATFHPWNVSAETHASTLRSLPDLLLPEFLAHFCEQRWLALKVGGEFLDRAQGGWADVMFHAFDVVIDEFIVETQEL